MGGRARPPGERCGMGAMEVSSHVHLLPCSSELCTRCGCRAVHYI